MQTLSVNGPLYTPHSTFSVLGISRRVNAKICLQRRRVHVSYMIVQGFVGVLDTGATLYVWDQCFMSGWSHATIENICIVLIQLISYKLTETEDFTTLKDVSRF